MNQHTTRNMSQTGNRLDAGFHVKSQQLAARVRALEVMGAAQAIGMSNDLMGELTGEQRERVLGILRTGTRKGAMGTFEAHTLVRKHPFMSLALLEEFLPKAQQVAQQELARAQARMAVMNGFEKRLREALDPAGKRKATP